MGKGAWLHSLAQKVKVVRDVSAGTLVIITLVLVVVEAVSSRKKEAEGAGE